MSNEVILTVAHSAGLHARPLAQFVKVVKQFDASVDVWNLTLNKGPAKGDSPLKLMLLTVQQGHQIRIHADGAESEAVIKALSDLIHTNFGEAE